MERSGLVTQWEQTGLPVPRMRAQQHPVPAAGQSGAGASHFYPECWQLAMFGRGDLAVARRQPPLHGLDVLATSLRQRHL